MNLRLGVGNGKKTAQRFQSQLRSPSTTGAFLICLEHFCSKNKQQSLPDKVSVMRVVLFCRFAKNHI